MRLPKSWKQYLFQELNFVKDSYMTSVSADKMDVITVRLTRRHLKAVEVAENQSVHNRSRWYGC